MTPFKPSTPPAGGGIEEIQAHHVEIRIRMREMHQSEIAALKRDYKARRLQIFYMISHAIFFVAGGVMVNMGEWVTGLDVFNIAWNFAFLTLAAYQYGYHSYRPNKP